MPESEGDLMGLHSHIVLDSETLVRIPETSHKAAAGPMAGRVSGTLSNDRL